MKALPKSARLHPFNHCFHVLGHCACRMVWLEAPTRPQRLPLYSVDIGRWTPRKRARGANFKGEQACSAPCRN